MRFADMTQCFAFLTSVSVMSPIKEQHLILWCLRCMTYGALVNHNKSPASIHCYRIYECFVPYHTLPAALGIMTIHGRLNATIRNTLC